jgi:GntR family transcriptional regulator, transcriptional repressor for pyruvate dehydrogenase complex
MYGGIMPGDSPKAVEFPAITPLRPIKLADRVYERILEQIVSGHYREGARLPSEAQLSAAFSVSRPIVRDALARLNADGIILSRHGSGSYVQRRPHREILHLAPIGGMADLMRCFEFRIAVEGEAAYLAASRRSDADLQAMAEALASLEEGIANPETGSAADIQFHNAIAAASRNTLFESTLETLAAHTFAGMCLGRKLSLSRGQKRLLLIRVEHSRIFETIKMEDPDGARAAMRDHIEAARARVLTDSTEP